MPRNGPPPSGGRARLPRFLGSWAVTSLVVALLGLLLACTEEKQPPATVWPAGFSTTAVPAGFPTAAPPREQPPATFGFGRPATDQEIRTWDVDVMPDGTGLPPGSGTVAQGALIYANTCAMCHGPTGREGPFDRLVGKDPDPRQSFPFGRGERGTPPRTIGNYWPYATTIFDFVNRAMPLPEPGSLQPDEVYSLVAWLLHQNEIIPEHAVLNQTTLPQVKMPARDRFIEDNRRGGSEIR